MAQVELIGHYGGDETHALSAWTSTSRELTDDRQRRIDKMLKTLAEAGHHTPFEKSFLHFLVEVDTASHIQILKHRVGVSVNAESARYKQIEPQFHLPIDWPPEWQERLHTYSSVGRLHYERALKDLTETLGRKRAKESARFFLPYANMLALDVSFNFRSLMHFMGLRNKDDAQDEIHWVAEQMLNEVKATGDFRYSLEGFGYG